VHLRDDDLIATLARWRDVNMSIYPTQFRVSVDGTRDWLRDTILGGPDRLLFLIRRPDRRIVGHIGFMELSEADRSLRLAYMMSENAPSGLITAATWRMHQWAAEEFEPDYIWAPPFADNDPPIGILAKLGYRNERLIPLRKVESPGRIDYLPMDDDDRGPPDRFWRRMIFVPGESRFDENAEPAPIDLDKALREWNKS
jgi:RimJ/RimL family protein N-acetyltransferase